MALRRAGHWAWIVGGWTLTLCLVAVIAVCVGIPRLAGATPYVVLTGSMRPGMPPGTLVVVRPVDARSIQVGDVITYQLASGEPDVVTHRVVTQGLDLHGRPVFRTQGDANTSPDPAWVRPVQVKGERWYAVPHLGRVSALLTANQHRLLSLVVGALLLAYAATAFVRSWRSPRRRPPRHLAHA